VKLTIADIAKQAGVSKATVSRVLNRREDGVGDDTRARILKILADTGFQPSATARCLATGESRSIGLIIPDIANPFFALLVRGAEAVLNQEGYSLFLCNAGRSVAKESDYIRALIEKHVDGVILNSAGSALDTQVEALEAKGIPVVLLDRVIKRRESRFGVFVDNQHGAREAVMYLYSRKDCDLLFLNGPAELSQSMERLAGVEEALHELGIPAQRLRVINSDFTPEGGYHAVSSLLGLAGKGAPLPFNAIFAANDLMAIGAARALRQRNIRVPEDVELIGFDDIEFAAMLEPPLSTIAQPAQEMGASSAELLLRLIAGQKPRQKTLVMSPKLVLRGTTRPRPASATQQTPHTGAIQNG
jgi:LacI family transcriptional regulator